MVLSVSLAVCCLKAKLIPPEGGRFSLCAPPHLLLGASMSDILDFFILSLSNLASWPFFLPLLLSLCSCVVLLVRALISGDYT